MATFPSVLWLSNSPLCVYTGFLAGSVVKDPLAMQETQERQVQEDPLEEGMATYSSILAWDSPGKTEKPGRLQSIGPQRVRQD